ncbi:MAG: acetyl-CoA carboxylase biotin carboxylase subunit [Deltaproteobacteria bacterium]|jgi:acetyl-CoA carboxylase, biotin carboxylase subunit|nr:acetyl-CoA carboxylase biotin carboxylase subunit [Deltaproteobacteria bacterium]
MSSKTLFSKILIANRGEIAHRVIRSCKEMGIHTVAVYSEADRESLHLSLADERVCIGPAVSSKSYLNMEIILQAAKETGADAIHPGYGYLSEREKFATLCEAQGLAFIGPTAANLKLAGDKLAAKKIAESAGVPVIPSSRGHVPTVEEAKVVCGEMGYPVMIKSAGGGGGRGIRICEDEETLVEEFPIARMEAGAAFGDATLYIEKFIAEPRHIEFQVLCDTLGHVAHLGERECTIQRRFQKLIEESPSPFVSPTLRREMGEAAMAVLKAADYVNAGTVEFLVDKNGAFYFMEINARIQVEHPVTELTTGIDLVKEQIRLAAGEPLGYSFDDLSIRGWAMECRINAEDPDRGFAPSPGTITHYRPPGGFGVRLDTHLYQGYELPIFYDSLMAKLVTHDLTRLGAVRVMKRALEEFQIEPIKTTIPLYLHVMDDPKFLKGDFHTGFIKRFVQEAADEDED